MTPKEKAIQLVEYFEFYIPQKLSDYSGIYTPTAKMFATRVCDEVLADMGADRGYEFWTNVKQEIKKL